LLHALGSIGGWATLEPPSIKRLHWHIDYLLERPEAEIAGVLAILTVSRLEPEIAERLATCQRTAALAPGLGAADQKAGTHLLRVPAEVDWWDRTVDRVIDLAARRCRGDSPPEYHPG
jgi:Uri superfamily endonuclease